MAGDKERKSRPITFAGGSLTDQPVAGQESAYDLENLLPPSGGGRGLIPRDGIEHVVGLTTDDTSGHVIHKVTLDDVARTELIVVSSAETGRVELITDHTDMEGLQSVPPRGGGELPNTEPLPDAKPLICTSEDVSSSGGDQYNCKVWFYSSSAEACFGPVELNGYTDSNNVQVLRTKNFMVRLLDVYDLDNPDKYQLDLDIYDLHKVNGGISDLTKDRGVSVVVNPYTANSPGMVIPYGSDKVFVLLGRSLILVDLVTGGQSVVSADCAGMPAGEYFIGNGLRGYCSTDSLGYLWAFSESSDSGNYHLMRIDPINGDVKASAAITDPSWFTSVGFLMSGFHALPSGEMLTLVSGDTEDTTQVVIFDQSLSAIRHDVTNVKPAYAGRTSGNALVGGCLIAWSDPYGDAQVFHATAPIGTVGAGIPYAYTRAGFAWDGAHLGCVVPDFVASEYLLIKCSVGDGSFSTVSIAPSGNFDFFKAEIPDSFGYGVTTLQGDLLT